MGCRRVAVATVAIFSVVVIGPVFARDGMGTSSALETLLARTRALKLSVGFADPFYDIDVADDLTRLAAELRLDPARAPRTAGWLKEWGFGAAQFRTGTGEL
jgi:hypothetical protein